MHVVDTSVPCVNDPIQSELNRSKVSLTDPK